MLIFENAQKEEAASIDENTIVEGVPSFGDFEARWLTHEPGDNAGCGPILVAQVGDDRRSLAGGFRAE